MDNQPNFIFIDRNVDIQAIKRQLYENMDDWYGVHNLANLAGEVYTKHFLPITMGRVERESDSIKDSDLQVNTPYYKKYTEIVKWLDSVGCSNHSRAAFLRLEIGGAMGRHVDDGLYYTKRDRYHLSIQGEYVYEVDGEEQLIRPGTFFWFHNKRYHSAKNVGNSDRITFVFDVPYSDTNPHHNV